MKRLISMLLAAALLLSLAGCGTVKDERVNPISFYYKNVDIRYDADENVIYGLKVDLDDPNIPISEIVSRYLEGPDEAFLESPFPPATTLVDCQWVDNLLTITVSNQFASLSGLNTTLAMACLTYTLTQINGVDAICVLTEDGSFNYCNHMPLNRENFLLSDSGSLQSPATANLYFADSGGEFLLLETRTTESGSLSTPEMVMQALIDGPGNENLQPVIPAGTQLRSLELNGGVCTVDLSYDFIENCPETAAGEHLTVTAIVNSLTELESIQSVILNVEGQRITTYRYLNLSEPLVRDETAIGPIRDGLNEIGASLYFYSAQAERLAGLPMRLRRSASQTEAEAVLFALIHAVPPNGLTNPVPADTQIRTIRVEDGICYVDLSREFLSVHGNYTAEQSAVRAIVCTLCGLPSIRRVQLTVEGSDNALEYVSLAKPISAQHSWSVE